MVMAVTAQPAPPPLLRELTPEAFQLWRHSAVTQVFLTYLADKAEDYQDQLLAEALSDIDLPEGRRGYMRGLIWCLRELRELPLDAIQTLYGIVTPEEKAET